MATFSDPNDKEGRLDESDYEEFEAEVEVITLRHCVDHIIRCMAVKGYILRQDISGAWCGFRVYTEQHVMLDGIELDCKIYKTMPETQNTAFLTAIERIVMAEIADLDPKTHKSSIAKWFTAYSSFERPRDVNSPVYRISFTFATNWCRPLAMKPCEGAYKIAPGISMIPQHVRDLDIRRLLHVLPEAEYQMMLLALGRAVVGHTMQTRVGTMETLEHYWRGWFLLQSDTAGMGKSTWLELLGKVLSEFGYVVSGLPPRLGSSFGWYEPSQADVVIQDDFNDADQQLFMSSEYVKKMASNGMMTTEEKGVKNLPPIKSKSIIFGATNTYRQAHFLKMDQGCTSRANILGCYPEHTLEVPTIIGQWLAIAEEYDTTWDVLMTMLLAKAKDVFLDAAKDGRKLAKTYDRLRDLYVNKMGLSVVTDIVNASERLVAIVISDMLEEEINPAFDKIANFGFTGEYMLCVIRASMQGLPINCPDLSRAYAKSFDAKYPDYRISLEVGGKDIFKTIADSVRTNEGWNIPDKASKYGRLSIANVKKHLNDILAMPPNSQKALRKTYDLAPIINIFT